MGKRTYPTSKRIWYEDGDWWYHWDPETSKTRVRCMQGVCEYCGRKFASFPGQPTKHCSKKHAMQCVFNNRERHPEKPKIIRSPETHPRWQGGRSLNRSGYVMVRKPDHPSVQGTKRTRVLEHRLVMEEHLGRLLLPTETVHHRNGVRDDNRIENLELWENAQPPGQRATEHLPHCPTCTCFD